MYHFVSKHSSDRYVLFCHDLLSHLAINASLCMKLMYTMTDFVTFMNNYVNVWCQRNV